MRFVSATWPCHHAAVVLATLAYSSWCLRPWAWPMTLVVYGVGVLGSLWQVSVGIPQGWVAAIVKHSCFHLREHTGVRRAYVGAHLPRRN